MIETKKTKKSNSYWPSSISTTLHAIEVSPPKVALQRRYTGPKVFTAFASFPAILGSRYPAFQNGQPQSLWEQPKSPYIHPLRLCQCRGWIRRPLFPLLCQEKLL